MMASLKTVSRICFTTKSQNTASNGSKVGDEGLETTQINAYHHRHLNEKEDSGNVKSNATGVEQSVSSNTHLILNTNSSRTDLTLLLSKAQYCSPEFVLELARMAQRYREMMRDSQFSDGAMIDDQL